MLIGTRIHHRIEELFSNQEIESAGIAEETFSSAFFSGLRLFAPLSRIPDYLVGNGCSAPRGGSTWTQSGLSALWSRPRPAERATPNAALLRATAQRPLLRGLAAVCVDIVRVFTAVAKAGILLPVAATCIVLAGVNTGLVLGANKLDEMYATRHPTQPNRPPKLYITVFDNLRAL